MKNTLIKKYAELLVRTGLHLKKNQNVIIQANCDQEEFVALVVKECYEAGAKRVLVRWSSQKVAKQEYKKAKESALSDVLPFELCHLKAPQSRQVENPTKITRYV